MDRRSPRAPLSQIVVVACLAGACAATPREATLRLDEAQTVAFDGGASLSLLWQAVEDSRCPLDVVCVWEGEVAVDLVVDPEAAADTVRLTRRHEGDERARTTVSGFELELRAVDPYPASAESPTPREEYRALVVIAPPGERLPARTAVDGATWGRVKSTLSAR